MAAGERCCPEKRKAPVFTEAQRRPSIPDPLATTGGLSSVQSQENQGISRLFTFNGADFRRFGSLIEVIVP